MKRTSLFLCLILASLSLPAQKEDQRMLFPDLGEVVFEDALWSPIMERTAHVTQWDVWQKFRGETDGGNPKKNAWRNFELVAEGHAADGGHIGFPWFDGLLYETMTGMSDLLSYRSDDRVIKTLDHAAALIGRAQAADPDGYLNTYTTLEENGHRWGENGGNLRWQHDVYNSGCLVEAGVHMYEATGHTQLLGVAVRLANYMYDYMVDAHRNLIPGHALPEDALLQLYGLCMREPDLQQRLQQPLHPEHYRRLAEYWIEQRGHTEGRRPLEQYAQDAEPVFDAQTIEGHAVRATLLATGVAHAALANRDPRYIEAARRLWDNMVGRRMFITGGVGAIHEDEKFGPDYYLPTDAYLETCAAIGAGLFSWRMYELTGEAKYMDVVERILFNSIPTAVGVDGKSYTYQNPLNADDMSRWPWHDCPCCPPMLLKWLGQMPRMIYAHRGKELYVNLFVGGNTKFTSPYYGKVSITQTVDWLSGKVTIHCDVQKHRKELQLNVRVPGWMRGEETPGGLYESDAKQAESSGYITYHEADVKLILDAAPRIVRADERVMQLRGMASLASGPFVYCVERVDNEKEWNTLNFVGRSFVLDTTHMVTSGVPEIVSSDYRIRAIPYFMIANRSLKTSYRVWIPDAVNHLSVNPLDVKSHITPYLYGAGMEDVNHEVYGGFYDQMLFGESFEEGPQAKDIRDMRVYDHAWRVQGNEVNIAGCKTAKLVYAPLILEKGSAEVELRYDGLPGSGNAAGLCMSMSDCGDGADNFRGYEVSLHGSGQYIILGKHDHNFQSIGHYPVAYAASEWNRLRVDIDGARIIVFLNGTQVCEWEDEDNPLPSGEVALRTYEADASFRNLCLTQGAKTSEIVFAYTDENEVSGMWDGQFDSESDARFSLVQGREAKHGAQAQRMENCNDRGTVSLDNMGLNRWGISLRKGHELKGSVWIKGKARQLRAALCSKDGLQRYAMVELPSPTPKWKRVSFSLTPEADDSCACFKFEMTGKGQLLLDAAELMHTGDDQYKGMPLRADIGEMFHAQGLTFLRYGGSMVNSPEYRYAPMRGERQLRPPYKGFWYPFSTNGFGIQEFVDFAEAEGYERSFAVNIEDDPEDCAQMIRDLKGRIRYVEIGNEEVIAGTDQAKLYDHYVERFLLLSEAMRKEDPQLEFVCAAWWRPESEDVKRTFLALDGKADFWDFHPWVDDYQSAMSVEGAIRLMQKKFHEWNPNTTMRCAIFEENGNSHRVRRMLCHAIVQNAVRRMGDFVLCTCPANALEPFEQNDNGWNQGQIFFTPSQAWGMPPYYGQQLASKHHQPLLVSCSLATENPQLDISATRSEDGHTVVLHLVNTGDTAQALMLDIPEEQNHKQAFMSTICGDEDDRNTPTDPRHIIPQDTDIDLASPVVLPAHSYNVISIKESSMN